MKKILLIGLLCFGWQLQAMQSSGRENVSSLYKKLDVLLSVKPSDINWDAVFGILNKMNNDDISAYRLENFSLLGLAVANYFFDDRKDISVVKSLLAQYHMNPNIKNRDGTTPLMLVCFFNDFALAQLLLQYGANPYAMDSKGNNSFYWAIDGHAAPKLDELLKQYSIGKAKVSSLYKILDDLLYRVKPSNINWDAVFSILDKMDKYDINAYRFQDSSLLELALSYYSSGNEDISVIKSLLAQYHLNPNIKDRRGITPLMTACERGNMALITLLLEYGGDLYLRDFQGRNSLYYVTHNFVGLQPIIQLEEYILNKDNSEISWYKKLDFLLSGGRHNWDAVFSILDKMNKDDISAYRLEDSSLLELAVSDYRNGDEDISVVKSLLEIYHIDPNIKNQDGTTPLMIACAWAWGGDIAVVKLLLEYGADPFLRDFQGRDSFYYATNSDGYAAPQIIDLLEQYKLKKNNSESSEKENMSSLYKK